MKLLLWPAVLGLTLAMPLRAQQPAGAPAGTAAAAPAAQARVQLDPFLLVVDALAQCQRQQPTLLTPAEVAAQAHYRAERGTSCYQAGRCRLPNAYLYDAEIIPRVKKALLADDRFSEASIWVEGSRRWVWLKGCVRSAQQAAEAEARVRALDDVEAVINQLEVWPPRSLTACSSLPPEGTAFCLGAARRQNQVPGSR